MERVPAEPPALDDGYYWFRNWINLRGGGHVDVWKIGRVVGGKVQRFGSDSLIDLNCPYLQHALWVRAEPPDTDAEAIRLATEGRPRGEGETMGGGRSRAGFERVWAAAEEIVDALLDVSPAAVTFYRDRPVMKAELVAEVVRIIRSLGA